jgi:hypothetical protein
MKHCPRCDTEKPLDEFPLDPQKKDGRYTYCKPCKNAYMRDYLKRTLSSDDHFRRNLARACRRHGITLVEYDDMLAAQGGGCAICGNVDFGVQRRPCFDHDHETGAFRGLLCAACNNGLGNFRDSPRSLRRAADYLEQSVRAAA